ncbi:MAG: hypothetical protein IT164_09140 [Bryobacterales bacterium]|nr:hypothetical protein [Bryobacterales bacterium]
MTGRRQCLAALAAGVLRAQSPAGAPTATSAAGPVEFTCPMDRDVKQSGPGRCPRCGMKLTARLPEPAAYGFDIRYAPRPLRAGVETRFDFGILDPGTGKPVRRFEVVHEKLFHLFLVTGDLGYFAHEHPSPRPNGRFHFRTTLPRPGAYRAVADCYPSGGAPQFLARTLITVDADASALDAARLPATPFVQQAANLEVELTLQPPLPVAGFETKLFFRLRPAAGLEQYLAAWGHMLAASDDLVDVIHDHPLYAYPDEPRRPQVQFNVIFPRPRGYRVWVQFQRLGVVNTSAFNIAVRELA